MSLRKILTLCINFYQIFISRVLIWFATMCGVPCQCRFPISCSVYAKQVLATEPTFKALKLIFVRLASCSPLYPLLKHSHG